MGRAREYGKKKTGLGKLKSESFAVSWPSIFVAVQIRFRLDRLNIMCVCDTQEEKLLP